jgi:hypothetical protein
VLAEHFVEFSGQRIHEFLPEKGKKDLRRSRRGWSVFDQFSPVLNQDH